MSYIRIVLALSLLGVICSCANQLPPTGGPKDEDPPILIHSKPDSFALNFNESVIELTFNETVKLFSVKNELIITPTYNGSYDSKVKKGKNVILTFDTPFSDSTTYTLNFREAVKDITEGNVVVNLRLAFSTWGFIDSLSIEGNVTDLLTLNPSTNYTVGIFDIADTITPLNGTPLYFTRTDSAGYYQLQNIKGGEYQIISFNDLNNNLLIDSRSEKYGFLTSVIMLDRSYDSLDIETQFLDFNDLEIISSRQNGQYFEIKLSKYITDYSLTPLDSTHTLMYDLVEKNRTIKIYNTVQIEDSLALYVEMTDSMQTTLKDTVFVKFGETKREKDDFTFKTNSTINIEDAIFKSELSFSKPIARVLFDSMKIVWDSVSFTTFLDENIKFNSRKTGLTILKSLETDPYFNSDTVEYEPKFSLFDVAFITIEEDSSKSINSLIQNIEINDFGIIRGKISIPYEHFIVQLLDENSEVIDFVSNVDEYNFDYIPAANYMIRVLIDEDNNGTWFPGNLIENIKHEPVLYFKSAEGNAILSLRANWELVDINIEIDSTNVN